MAHVGQEIRRVREERGLNQTQLAVVVGTGPAAISRIENGRQSPNMVTLEKIARALEVEVADLFPKDQAPLSFDVPEDEEAREWRLLGYVRSWILLLDNLSERWEKAAAEGGFSLDTFEEFSATFDDVVNASNSLIEGLKRHQGIDAMQGAIGHRFRKSLIRAAQAAGALAEAAADIYGANELARVKRGREAATQHIRAAELPSASQGADSTGVG
jgi:transcriptional regulator with XRE-family HTH domain